MGECKKIAGRELIGGHNQRTNKGKEKRDSRMVEAAGVEPASGSTPR